MHDGVMEEEEPVCGVKATSELLITWEINF
jgi:hypothetical protein